MSLRERQKMLILLGLKISLSASHALPPDKDAKETGYGHYYDSNH